MRFLEKFLVLTVVLLDTDKYVLLNSGLPIAAEIVSVRGLFTAIGQDKQLHYSAFQD